MKILLCILMLACSTGLYSMDADQCSNAVNEQTNSEQTVTPSAPPLQYSLKTLFKAMAGTSLVAFLVTGVPRLQKMHNEYAWNQAALPNRYYDAKDPDFDEDAELAKLKLEYRWRFDPLPSQILFDAITHGKFETVKWFFAKYKYTPWTRISYSEDFMFKEARYTSLLKHAIMFNNVAMTEWMIKDASSKDLNDVLQEILQFKNPRHEVIPAEAMSVFLKRVHELKLIVDYDRLCYLIAFSARENPIAFLNEIGSHEEFKLNSPARIIDAMIQNSKLRLPDIDAYAKSIGFEFSQQQLDQLLYRAVHNGYSTEIVETYLNLGANPFGYEITAFTLVANIRREHHEVLEAILKSPAYRMKRYEEDSVKIIYRFALTLIEEQRLAELQLMFDVGELDVHYGKDGLLRYATKVGSKRAAALLLEQGADPLTAVSY